MGYIKEAIPKQSDSEITTALLFSQHPSHNQPQHIHTPNNINNTSNNTNNTNNVTNTEFIIQNPYSSSSSSFSSLNYNSMSSYDPENGASNGAVSVNNDNSNHHQQQQQQTIVVPETAHQISTDSWLQAGFVLTTGINSAYVLGYSGAIMVPLGWIPAVLGLIAATGISLYANALIAKLHEYGGKRHIRYRDLAGFIYGPRAYSLTWALQYINLFMINTGFIILAGSSIKAAYELFTESHALKLPYCIIISGFVCALFAIGIPHLSALRIWLGVSTFFGLIYIVIAIALSLKDGLVAETFPVVRFYSFVFICLTAVLFCRINSPPRDYTVPTERGRVFTTIGAAANLVFAFNTGMLPEIQATVRKPVVGNMMKALYFQFSAGVVPMYAIVFIGYWAYGNKTDSYLLNNVHGPVWVKALANISTFLQTVIALHIFASPMYEYLDTRFGITGSALHPKNLGSRVLIRGGYLALNTFVSALLPFLGDFMSLTGAISTFPLTFILANHMYFKAKRNKLSMAMKIWLWINIVFFSCMSVASFIAALRLIAVDSKTYHVFADLEG